jgi:hypothetical protein
MTGAFGPTISLATSEFLPVGRTRVNRRGCITCPFLGREIQQTSLQNILKISFSSMVTELRIAVAMRAHMNKAAV